MTARTTLLVSDGTVPWQSVADRLAGMPEIDIIGLVTDFDVATAILHQRGLVAVLSAAEIGGQSALPFLASARLLAADGALVVVSHHPDRQDMRALMMNQISGYLLWQALPSDVAAYTLAAAADPQLSVVSRALIQLTDGGVLKDRIDTSVAPHVTQRQRSILEGLLEEETTGQIARRIGVSEPTVKREIAELENRFGVSTRFALAVAVTCAGLLWQTSRSLPDARRDR